MLRVASGSVAYFDTIIATPLDHTAVLNLYKQVSRCTTGLELCVRRQSSRTIDAWNRVFSRGI